MAIYMIIDYEKIENEASYLDYIKKAEQIVKKYNGKYIVRTNKIKAISGTWKPERIVIIRFDSENEMKKCFGSEEYKSLSSLRVDSTKSKSILVEEYVD